MDRSVCRHFVPESLSCPECEAEIDELAMGNRQFQETLKFYRGVEIELSARVQELEKALELLAEHDFEHGFDKDTHSLTCRKCIALNPPGYPRVHK